MKRANFGVTSRVFRPLDWALVIAIGIYQKRISPRKGWRCAHCLLHGGPSCSGYVKTAIQNHGWREAIPMAKKRFAACKQASRIMRAQAESPWSSPEDPAGASSPTPTPGSPNRQKKGCQSDWCDVSCCNGCDALDWLFDCGPGDTGCIDCGNCSPCD